MTENNNEIVLTMSMKKYILTVVFCIFIIATGGIAVLRLDFDCSDSLVVIAVAIGTLLSQIHRIEKIKESKIDTNKYFNFKYDVLTSIIIFSVLILDGMFFKNILIHILAILMCIFGLQLLVSTTIKYFKKRPIVLINYYGIKRDFDIFSPELDILKWEEVKEVFKYEDISGKCIGILPENMKSILGERSWIRRLLIGKPKILTICQREITTDIDDLYTEIKNRLIVT
ncbi:hypothetical protein SH2C18_23130 [Clostridium sediminicola]|uniref:hypothetical protein n=1 Tax=Clostridium sediminicola TaxID=3114879 RepID=UPI0031F26911